MAAFDGTLGTARVRLFQEDCVAGMAQRLAPGSVSVVVTSPPYNLGIQYASYDDTMGRADYLAWLGRWAEVVRAVLAEEGSLFLNIGGKPSDPWVPFEVVTEMRRQFHLQNVIHWIKSIAIEKADVGDYPGITGNVAVGHFKPINSARFVNDCQEYVFHLTKTGKVPLDRLAIGVEYQDKCLSVYTKVIAKVDGETRVTELGLVREAFERGKSVQLPSYDFEARRCVWVDVLGFTAPKKQHVRCLKLRNGATVDASDSHRFPIITKNARNQGEQVLRPLTLMELEKRQARWTSVGIQLYVTQDLSALVPDSAGPLYNYQTGYVLGLYLAEGCKFGRHALRFAAHQSERDDPDFGGYLVDYFRNYFGLRVKCYAGKVSKRIEFQVDCGVFRAIVEEHIQGDSARTKRLNLNVCVRRGKPFLRGLIDGFVKGDGHYVEKYDVHEVGICDNRRLVEDLRTLCLLVGYEFKEQATTTTRSWGRSRKRLNFWLRKALYCGKRTPRHNGLVVEHLDSIARRRGKAPQGTLTIDVEVDIDHHMFFLANGILTHNSNVSRWRSAGSGRRCRGNTWFVPYDTIRSRSEQRPHPATFPIELARKCLRLHGLSRTKLVMDPFLGIGHAGAAAVSLGIDFVGFELDGAYMQEAIALLHGTSGVVPQPEAAEETDRQLPLFDA